MVANSDDSIPTEKTPTGHGPSPTLGTTEAPVASLCPPQLTFLDSDANGSKFIVVMGVSGTGKSTLGAALSRELHLPFIDGDDLHPAANVAKMSRGEPLDDGDRQPWLETIRKTAIARVLEQLGVDQGERTGQATESKTDKTLGEHESSMVHGGTVSGPEPMWGQERRPGVIVACSALKKTYRAVLRGENSQRSGMGSALDGYALSTYFVYLKGDRDVLMARMENRKGHFMKAGMLESQLNTLESPEEEPGVVTVSVEMSTVEQVQRVIEMLRS